MKKLALLATLLPLAAAAQSAPASAPAKPAASVPAAKPAPAGAATAESVKVGTGVANHDIEGESDHFKVAAGTKLYGWAQLAGMSPGTHLKIVWKKDGKEVSTSSLSTPVPTARWRTHGFRTFRAGDTGDWTATFMTEDGAELGSASFKVEITG